MLFTPLIQETQSLVIHIFQSFRIQNFPYHNLDHTQRVVKVAAELAQTMDLSPGEAETVLVAAWFHDTGYGVKYQGHEGASQQIAHQFLKRHQVPPEKISAILACIQATVMPQKPRNLMEQIICDADLAHLASGDFLNLQNELRREWHIYLGKVYSDEEWKVESLTFLNSHQYHTIYTRDNWNGEKIKNIQLLQSL
jgi:predicted metal-dependent HD superfamily phosphohydrolase